MRSWPPRWPETPVSAVGGDPPGRLPSGGKARENRPGSGVAHHWSSNAPNATADLVGGHERSTPEWPVSGAEPGCGPTLASNDAARPTLGVATTGGVARAGHDRTQRRARGHSPSMLWAARAWAARRAVRRPHAVSSSSWGRIHSASTIASASPSRTGSSRCVSVIILFTPFQPDVALLPVTGQALIAVFSSLLAILMRCGLAFSATGMANRSTPLW